MTTSDVTVQFDPPAIYITVAKGVVDSSEEIVPNMLFIDFDKDHNVIGIEVIK